MILQREECEKNASIMGKAVGSNVYEEVLFQCMDMDCWVYAKGNYKEESNKKDDCVLVVLHIHQKHLLSTHYSDD